MTNEISFIERCVKDTTHGLRKGLNQFSSRGKAALIYAIRKNDPLKIYDPDGLLTEHALKLRDFYFRNTNINICACQINEA